MATPSAFGQEQEPSAPASAPAPQPAAAPSTHVIAAPPRRASVQFVAPPGVVFYRIDSTESPVRICLPPCQVPMAGSTRLALSLNGDSPVTAPEKLNLTANSVVEGDYRSGSGKRTTGLILLALGIPAGIGTVAAGAGLVDVEPEDERWVAVSTIVGGALVLVGSLIAGIIWASTADEAHVFERSSEEPLGF